MMSRDTSIVTLLQSPGQVLRERHEDNWMGLWMSQWNVLYTKEGSSIGKEAIWKHSRRSQFMAKHCNCAVLVQYSYETGHCNCAVAGTHLLGHLWDCQFHWANRLIFWIRRVVLVPWWKERTCVETSVLQRCRSNRFALLHLNGDDKCFKSSLSFWGAEENSYQPCK